jgi:hypothetical protein
MIFVTSARCSLAIDLGWYPDFSPEGQFRVEVVDLDNCAATYAKPLREFATRSAWAAKQKMENWMQELHASPTESKIDPKELASQVVETDAVPSPEAPASGPASSHPGPVLAGPEAGAPSPVLPLAKPGTTV